MLAGNAIVIMRTIPKLKRYLCWHSLPWPGQATFQNICKMRPPKPPPCRLDIIFNLEMVLL